MSIGDGIPEKAGSMEGAVHLRVKEHQFGWFGEEPRV
jgi:hypothetical protein